MKKLVIFVAVAIGVWQWYNGELPFMSPVNAFDESGRPVVQMFTVANCGKACSMARNELKKRRVAYDEIRIDPHNDSEEYVKLWKQIGRNSFPLIISGNEKINGSGTGPQMATLLGLNFGDKFLTSTEKRYYKNHFYPDGSPKIVLYGASWCPGCKKLRAEFEADNVDYIEIDVEKSGEKGKIARVMGVHGYPATWVGYTRVNGVTLAAINKVKNSY